VKDCCVIRLPALFGKGLKKNFIYDMINFLPSMLSSTKYYELSLKEPLIAENYSFADKGFYELTVLESERKKLKAAFRRIGFSALNFTESRSAYQYYNFLLEGTY
jgi:hypothetical protein